MSRFTLLLCSTVLVVSEINDIKAQPMQTPLPASYPGAVALLSVVR